jgi:uncharacterized protein (DUF2336 family)
MLVSSFLAWFENAAPRERAEAVDMLAHAYLAGALAGDSPEAAEAALTLVLDDPSRVVRRTLACAFAEVRSVPRHLILALAADQPDVAAPVLARSPILQEADLVDLANTVEPRALVALALRPELTTRIAAAIADRKDREATLALSGNTGATLDDATSLAIASRFGKDAAIREALLRRADVPAAARHQLMVALSEHLNQFLTEGGFLPEARARRTLDDAIQQGTVTIATHSQDDLAALVRYLRETARLTPGLVLRSVLGGDLRFLAETIAELAQLPTERVTGLLQARSDLTLAALIRRAGLPAFLENPMIAAIRASQELSAGQRGNSLSLPVIRAAQTACLSLEGGDELRLLALLRRYEAEAARAQSRRLAEELRLEAQATMAELRFNAEQTLALTALAADDEPAAIIAAPAAELQSEPAPMPAVQAAEFEPVPDLKTIIAEWKRERDQRRSEPAPPVPANGSAMDGWELRRRLA